MLTCVAVEHLQTSRSAMDRTVRQASKARSVPDKSEVESYPRLGHPVAAISFEDSLSIADLHLLSLRVLRAES